jgi:hypothetical protein
MVVVEYLVYDDEPLFKDGGQYAGVAPAYGSIVHVETSNPSRYGGNEALPSECVWIVPGTINPDD